MSELFRAIKALQSDTIVASQAFLIDDVLACARADQISIGDAPSVIAYIDLQLAHNEVGQEIRDSLTRLHRELLLLCHSNA